MVTHSSKNDNTKTNTAWNGPHRLCPHSLSHRSSSSTAAPAPRGHHKPERIGHYELLPRRLGNPTTGACPCRSARTRATPAAAAPARQRASKRHAGWLSRVWAVLRGTVRRGTRVLKNTRGPFLKQIKRIKTGLLKKTQKNEPLERGAHSGTSAYRRVQFGLARRGLCRYKLLGFIEVASGSRRICCPIRSP